ncbi:hypothetical protein [Catenulispora yoronensis]|uniref:hypothetical protein n=1 Tax=Catenulispora yoronensis TaxID=450799 RepID=UPI0031D5E238
MHTGDLRYFLLSTPADALAIDSPDGELLTKDDVVRMYGASAATAGKRLDALHFQGGATRGYQTADGKYHVLVRLFRFSTAAGAKTWLTSLRPVTGWKAFPVSGYPDFKAYDIPVDPTLAAARLQVVGFRGDVFFEVNVFGQPPVDHNVLIDRLRKQIARLDTGS